MASRRRRARRPSPAPRIDRSWDRPSSWDLPVADGAAASSVDGARLVDIDDARAPAICDSDQDRDAELRAEVPPHWGR